MTETIETPQTELVPHGLYDIDIEEFRRRVQQPNRNISTAGKRFKFPDGASSPGPMDCIVLDYVEYNALYEGAYNPADLKSPICWAYGKYADEMGPNELEVDGVSETCAKCPKNAWTPNPSNPKKSVKECKNQFRLAVVEPNATESSEIYILGVSPTGRKHWSKYLATLKMANMRERRVVTTVDWDPNVQQTMIFALKKPHDVDAMVIQTLLTRCTEERMLYASPAR